MIYKEKSTSKIVITFFVTDEMKVFSFGAFPIFEERADGKFSI